MLGKTNHQFFTVGIAGGSGAGKTTAAQAILAHLGIEQATYLPYDAYYRDLSHLRPIDRDKVNFDHPSALDTDLFIEHLKCLKAGQPVDMPIYDFSTHTRSCEFRHVVPKAIIVAEGILMFTDERISELLDLRIFIDADADVRFIRRLQRDTLERGRSVESVVSQWLRTVRPIHLQLVEQSKRHAHMIIPEDGVSEMVLDVILPNETR